MSKRKIAVVGAGVIGLSAAYRLQTELKDVQVTVISDRFVPNITSAAAAGFWAPHLLGDTPIELQRRWSDETFQYLVDLEYREDASVAGVTRVSGYYLFSEEQKEPLYWSDIVFGCRKMTERELQPYKPEKNFGYFFTTLICQQSRYLPWIFDKFKKVGGMVQQKKVNDLYQLAVDNDLVINCTGTGAKNLIGDNKINPVRGQIIKVKAPWIKQFVCTEDDGVYAFPCVDGLCLGGTEQEGNWNTNVNVKDAEYIKSATLKLIPSLKNAEVIGHLVGLRPGRDRVRLEKEYRYHNGKMRKIIHNYGHGGCGVTLHWGCAGDVVNMAAEILTASSSKL